MLLMIGMPL